ncbi:MULTISPECIES: hypothetical protein [Actinoplanes]|uniref:hypothetical protein n=1 Tax=Actinoplanes TaxID=1865 RepID=UPI0005F2BDB5|nr:MULTISPECIES: hypothetical protein [Actinoplanes]GLY01285.1 hypothetical protein Acsp01_16640 [Actinoplanes sp. NBRC 101535]
MAELSPQVRAALRAEAARHVPDRGVMLNRIAARRAEPAVGRRWALTALRPVAAAASVVAALVVGFAGIRLSGDRDSGGTPAAPAPSRPVMSPPAVPSSPVPSAPGSPSSTPARTAPGRTSGGGPASTAPVPSWQPVDGFLASTAEVDSHSNETWAQGNLTVTTEATVTALDVVISVARTGGVADAGRWSSVPAEMLTMSVTEEKDALLYRFTLAGGRTLAPGSYVFATQYSHAAGVRDAGGDKYGAIAAADGRRAEVTGTFTTR